jgi:hypothetical protein
MNSLGREIYLILPSSYTSIKLDIEKQKILQTYFINLFI